MDYKKLLIMAGVSFVVMYVLMYAMVDKYENIYNNLNQFYMAAIMTSVMMLIEIIVMKSMYGKKVLITTTVLSLFGFILFFSFIRNQTAISDKDFLKSMISHHASALLMCKETKLQDIEIKNLCDSIIAGQQSEINWMKKKIK